MKLAQDFDSQLTDVQSQVGFAQTDVAFFVGDIIQVAFSILGVILLLLILYAGFLWMTAGGESDKVDKAKQYMINAVIGLAIVLASYAITDFIISAVQQV